MKTPQLTGSVAGLTENELACLQTLVEQCRDRGLLERPPALAADDVVDGVNDEATLLRFLRGRSFDVAEALRQFEEASAIRSSIDAIAVYDSMDIGEFEQTRRMYPHWTGRRTRGGGLPVCVFDVAHLDHSALSNYSKERTTSQATCRAIVGLDYLTRFVLPLCSAAGDGPVSSAVYLVDIASFTFKQAWNVRGYAQDISKLLATCYPEVVDKVYVLNAASAFAKIWSLLKKWIEPRTVAKLVIVPSAEVLSTLSQTIAVEDIPKQYGGEFEDLQAMSPRLDDNLKELLAVTELPTGPIKWVADEQGNRAAVAVGSRKGGVRDEVLARIRYRARVTE